MPSAPSFLLPLPQDFSFKECLWFLDRGFDDCMHRVAGKQLYKALELEGQAILVRLGEEQAGLRVEVLSGQLTPAIQHQLTAFIRDWFDMDRDVQPFYRLLHRRKPLAYMALAFEGLRLIGIPDLFEALCWSIIGQQINLTFAYRLKRRLTERYGTTLRYKGSSYYIFPDPAVLATVAIAELRAMQFSQKKAEYITGLAGVFREGLINKKMLQGLSSFAAQQQALTALRGIGIWTANYALMKSLRVAEAIPYGDVGLLQALQQHGLIRDRKDQESIDRLFRAFKGWEAYLVFYLWRSLAQTKKL